VVNIQKTKGVFAALVFACLFAFLFLWAGETGDRAVLSRSTLVNIYKSVVTFFVVTYLVTFLLFCVVRPKPTPPMLRPSFTDSHNSR
jgi:hypothetical protein